jgi:DNA-directed RNA polymerase specialized sigma24 family protein
MSGQFGSTLGKWWRRAQAGDASAVGHLLERYRPYLRLLVRCQIGRHLGVRLDASDVV